MIDLPRLHTIKPNGNFSLAGDGRKEIQRVLINNRQCVENILEMRSR